MTLVLFNAELNKFALYDGPVRFYGTWRGEPWLVWKSVEIAMEYGWVVIGEF